jgi:trk system potassium uptake protein TrkA
MKHIAILGLGHFGKSVLDELLDLKAEVFIIDKDRQVVDSYKDASAQAVILDILSVENLHKVLPESIDSVVIDMGHSLEASILATSYCAKLKVKTIIAKAETESHAEILELVGATKVVFPNQEAAKRITPLLLSSVLLNYLPVSGNLVIAELPIPAHLIGKTVAQTELRNIYQLNLISIRVAEGEFRLAESGYTFQNGDVGLFCGTDAALNSFTAGDGKPRSSPYRAVAERFFKFFSRRPKNKD